MGDRTISEAIQALAGTQLNDRVYAFDASVVSVNIQARTCECELITGKDSVTLPEVRLMADIDDGMLIVPAIDSTVTIITSTYGDAYVSSFSEVEKIILMGGDLGGMVKLLETVKSLNNLEKDINNLKKAFTAWTVAPGDGGAALKLAAASWISNTLTETTRTDLENPNITQG